MYQLSVELKEDQNKRKIKAKQNKNKNRYAMQNVRNELFLQFIQSFLIMARGKPICKEIRSLILDYYKSGNTFGQIAKRLNLSKSSVQGIVAKFKKTGNIDNNIGNRGRTSAITARDRRALATIVKADRRQSLRNVASDWSSKIGKSVKREWTRLQLRDIGYKFYKVCIGINFVTNSIS